MIDSMDFEKLIELRDRFESEKQGDRRIADDDWKPDTSHIHAVTLSVPNERPPWQQGQPLINAPKCQSVDCDNVLTISDYRGICRQCIIEKRRG